MRKLIVASAAVLVLGVAPAAWAEHPSENRNEQGFGGGPHCHENVQSGQRAYPSHTAHLATGDAGQTVFVAVDCPEGEAG